MKMKPVLACLLYAILAGCQAASNPEERLPPPVGHLAIGMEKGKVLAGLPASSRQRTETPVFLGLVNIEEKTWQEAGLQDLYLFFREHDGRTNLHAAQLVFRNETGRKQALERDLDTRMQRQSPNQWQTALIRADLFEQGGTLLKLTCERRE
jgi:hypothetical protein